MVDVLIIKIGVFWIVILQSRILLMKQYGTQCKDILINASVCVQDQLAVGARMTETKPILPKQSSFEEVRVQVV